MYNPSYPSKPYGTTIETRPSTEVARLKRDLLRTGSEPRTGPPDPIETAIGVVRRHPLLATAAVAACGLTIAASPTLRAGVRRAASSSIKGLAAGLMVKALGR